MPEPSLEFIAERLAAIQGEVRALHERFDPFGERLGQVAADIADMRHDLDILTRFVLRLDDRLRRVEPHS
jgi:DNA anti-recombination protein RmuC